MCCPRAERTPCSAPAGVDVLPICLAHEQGHVVRSWTRRWFELHRSALVYRVSEKGAVRGRITLAQVARVFAFDGEEDVLIALKTEVGKDFLLMAPTKAEAEAWVDAIRSATLTPRTAAELLVMSGDMQAEGILDPEVSFERRCRLPSRPLCRN
jgi:hypothetical protein